MMGSTWWFNAVIVLFSSATMITLCEECGQSLTGSGKISSPNYPHAYPNNVICTWRLTASHGSILLVRVVDLDTESGFDWLRIYNGTKANGAPLTYSLTGNYYGSVTKAILGSTATVVFTTDDDGTAKGFSIEFTSLNATAFTVCGGTLSGHGTVQSPRYPHPYPNNSLCTWTLRADAGSIVQLRLVDFNTESGYDWVRVHNSTATDVGPAIRYFSGNYYGSWTRVVLGEIATLVFSSDAAVSAKGFAIQFMSLNKTAYTSCGGELSGSGTLYSPNYPLHYPNNSLCTWKLTASEGKGVHLRLVNFNIESGYDYLRVYNGTNMATAPLSYSYSGNYYGSSARATLGSVATVVFESDADMTATGFLIEFTSIDTTPYTDCGGVVTNQGTLRSPHYPNPYPNNCRCTWTLRASQGSTVQLRLIDFDLESGFDTVLVYNSTLTAIGPLTHYYSGNYYGSGTRAAMGDIATVVFSSDSAVSAKGFNIEFTSVNKSTFTGCGGELSGSGTLSSPNYPHHYPNNSLCTWKLTAHPGKIVQLRLIDFNTESGYDYLKLYNGTNLATAPYTHAYSGNYYGSTTRATFGHGAIAVFTADAEVSAPGFLAEFTSLDTTPFTACGQSLTGHGTLRSPNYPLPYPNNSLCTWTLRAVRGSSVQLRFIDLDVESGYDAVKVYNSTEEAIGPLTYYYSGKYYSSSIRAVLGEIATVVFSSDAAVSAKGFSIEFTSVNNTAYTGCGGELNGSGTLSSPNYPAQYPNNSLCTWKLTASPGKVVNLRLLNFNTESGYDWLKIYNGTIQGAAAAPLIYSFTGSYYGSDTRATLGSTATVVFTSDADVTVTGFLAEFTSLDTTAYTACGGNLTGFGIIRSPFYPLPYPNNSRCTWILRAAPGGAIRLRLLSFNVESGNDWVRVYNSTQYSIGYVSNYYSGYYYGSGTRTALGEFATVVFSSDAAVSSSGFEIEFTSLNASAYIDCGGELTGSGTITSPNYPLQYPNSSICTWTLTASPGKAVLLRLVDVNVEGGYDYLRVYNGSKPATSPLAYTFSGNYYGGRTKAALGGVASVVFTSDADMSASGFLILFTSADRTPFKSCGGLFTGHGTLQSPNYPHPYPDNSLCVWVLRASADKVIQLRLSNFDVENGYDYVRVYNATEKAEGPVSYYYSGNYYGGGTRAILGATAAVEFSSDSAVATNGFSIEFTSVSKSAYTGCGGELSGSGTFFSPNYPLRYPDNSVCTWKLTATQGKFILLRLVDFNSESGYDILKVYNGTNPATAPLAYSYSGNYYGSGYTAKLGSGAAVAFTSDEDVTATGFLAVFTSVSQH